MTLLILVSISLILWPQIDNKSDTYRSFTRVSKFMHSTLQTYRLIPVSTTDDLLTKKYICPNLNQIIDSFQDLRDSLDLCINQIYMSRHGKPLKQMKSSLTPTYIFSELQPYIEKSFKGKSPGNGYPIGFCNVITSFAYNFIMANKELPAFLPLQQFLKQGGIFNIIWGGVRQEFFQTALQLGSYYFDISNDTVDINKPKLEIKKIVDSDFHDINSFKEFAEIKEKYHKVDIYRNHCLPGFFPYYPLFSVRRSDGQLELLIYRYMAMRSISDQFKPVFDLRDIPVLPKHYVKKIMNIYSFSGEGGRYLNYSLFSDDEIALKIEELKTLGLEEILVNEKIAFKYASHWNNLIKFTQKSQ